MRTQIYAYTEPGKGMPYVRFAQAFTEDECVTLAVRSNRGLVNEITITKAEALQLSKALAVAAVTP